jgi:hypothetical protein
MRTRQLFVALAASAAVAAGCGDDEPVGEAAANATKSRTAPPASQSVMRSSSGIRTRCAAGTSATSWRPPTSRASCSTHWRTKRRFGG